MNEKARIRSVKAWLRGYAFWNVITGVNSRWSSFSVKEDGLRDLRYGLRLAVTPVCSD